MKAFKGCVNKDCSAYQRVHFKDEERYCSYCGQGLEYVCACCWTPLKSKMNRLCPDCQKIKDDKNAKRMEMAKKGADVVMGVGPAAVAFAVKHKDQVIGVAKKVIKK